MTDITEGNHGKVLESLDDVAAELAKGNGCAVKLYLDSIPNEDDRGKAFMQLEEKYTKQYPGENGADRVRFEAYRDNLYMSDGLLTFRKQELPTYNRKISAYESKTVPGFIFGTDTYDGWPQIYSYTVNTDTLSVHSNLCRNLAKSTNPILDHGLSLRIKSDGSQPTFMDGNRISEDPSNR